MCMVVKKWTLQTLHDQSHGNWMLCCGFDYVDEIVAEIPLVLLKFLVRFKIFS